MNVQIPVSIGELFDKISILEIKNERITSEDRLTHVRKELQELRDCLTTNSIDVPQNLYAELKKTNQELWDIEDYIRAKEEASSFDSDFVKFARLDAQLNDQRFVIKRKINDHFNSHIKEQKSYTETTLTRKTVSL